MNEVFDKRSISSSLLLYYWTVFAIILPLLIFWISKFVYFTGIICGLLCIKYFLDSNLFLSAFRVWSTWLFKCFEIIFWYPSVVFFNVRNYLSEYSFDNNYLIIRACVQKRCCSFLGQTSYIMDKSFKRQCLLISVYFTFKNIGAYQEHYRIFVKYRHTDRKFWNHSWWNCSIGWVQDYHISIVHIATLRITFSCFFKKILLTGFHTLSYQLLPEISQWWFQGSVHSDMR